MEVIVLPEERSNEWAEFLKDVTQSVAWQNYDWADVIKRNYSTRFYPLCAVDSGAICGILPLYHVKTLIKGDVLISVPYAVAGGIATDSDEAENLLLNKAIEIAEVHNSCDITFKQYKKKINSNLRTDSNYFNRELDLKKGEAVIWNEFDEENKEKVKRMKNKTFYLEYPSQELDLFYRMLYRHHHQRGIPCVTKKWIKTLIQFGMYKIALLKNDNQIVAGTLVKEDHRDAISLPFTCVPSPEYENYAYVLYWYLIKRSVDLGKLVFHSGRIPENEETDKYRLGWGGIKHKYWYQYYAQNSTSTEYSTKRGTKRKVFTATWRHLPSFMTKTIGPTIVRQFP